MLGVWHFSFTVGDIDRSVEFYRDVLGFELVHTQVQDNEYTRNLVGYHDSKLLVAQLAVPGQPRGISSHDLELIQYVSPVGEPIGPDRYRPGAAHLALAVEDAHALWDKLREAGANLVSPGPQLITAGANKGGYAFYFTDPDQITLEGVQPPARRLPAVGKPA
jgi:catechol 2,3-dioxygenase-like lactoylglutathione lyase family enzyme